MGESVRDGAIGPINPSEGISGYISVIPSASDARWRTPLPKCRLAHFRKPALALFAASALLALGGCNMRTEEEMMEERVQRAEAAAKKAVAAQQAAEEALDKIRMEDRDHRSPDEEPQRDNQDGSNPMADSRQPEVQDGSPPDG